MRSIRQRLLVPVVAFVGFALLGSGCILYANPSLGQVDATSIVTARFTMTPGYSHLLANVYSNCNLNMACWQGTLLPYVNDSIGQQAILDCGNGTCPGYADVPDAILGLFFTQPADDEAYRCLSFDVGLNGNQVQYAQDSWRWWRPSNNGPNGGCPAALVGP